MHTSNINRLIIEKDLLIFENSQGMHIPMPNLTALLSLYKNNVHTPLGARIKDILQRDLGSLLIVETMLDMSHEITLNRLETGEISKNMKHVNDYYVILESEYEAAQALFNKQVEEGLLKGRFEECHFAHFPVGLVIKRENFPTYYNQNADTSIINSLL